MKRKIFSILFALVLVLMAFPAVASADPGSHDDGYITLDDTHTSLHYWDAGTIPNAWAWNFDDWYLTIATTSNALVKIEWFDQYPTNDVYELRVDGALQGTNPAGGTGTWQGWLSKGVHQVRIDWIYYQTNRPPIPGGSYYDIKFTVLAQESPTCVSPPPGMVSWWPGDGNTNDIQGPNNGILLGGASFGAGKVLQAFTFDGDGDAVRFGDVLDDVIAGSDKEFTIDLWVQANSMPDGDKGATVRADLFAKLGDSVVGSEDQRQISLILRPDGSLDFVFYGLLDGSSVRLVRASTKLVTGSWYHVAVVYDGPVDTNDGLDRVQMYINGNAETKTMVASSGVLGDIPNGNANLSIGAAVASNLNVGYSLDGNIDEVEIFDRALSASEIQAIYNAGSAGKCKARALDHFLGYKVKTTKVCDGGVTKLTLHYKGSSSTDVVVTGKSGVVLFEEEAVAPSTHFVIGTGEEKLGTSITITTTIGDVVSETMIHTSCSQPIYTGLTFGDFEVVEGESLKGGPLETPAPEFVQREVTLAGQFETGVFQVEKPDKLYNPVRKNDEEIKDLNTHLMSYKIKLVEYPEPPTCAPCKGGLTSLTLRNDGPTGIITVTAKDEVVFGPEQVASGSQFEVVGTGKDGKLDKDATITVDGELKATIHTSCSQPIGIDQTFGDFTVVDGESKDGEPICPIITVESQFGTIVVARDKPDRLLVPTAKSLTEPVEPLDQTGVDHFKGYKIKAPKDTPEFQVLLVDQFGQLKLYDVKKPTRLFVPVDKNGEGIKNPKAHLICYTIKPVKDQPKHVNVLGIYTNNQFGPLRLNTDKEEELLVPCLKILP